MSGEESWRSCYRHKNRVAIRDCACCGRPICRECESESGDNLLCLPCKQELKVIEEEKTPEEPGELELRKGSDRARLDLSDITVFEDGTIINPKPEPLAEVLPLEEEPEEEPAGSGAEIPAEDENKKVEEEDRFAEALESGAVEEDVRVETQSGAASAGPVETAVVDSTERRAVKDRFPRLGIPKRRRLKEEGFVPGGPGKQLLYALPYALLTAGALTGVWLLVAVLAKNWSQASVFSTGIAVPWVLYKCTTMKKHYGRPVWNEPPPAVMMSVISGAIILVCIPFMEYSAFRIISKDNAFLPWSDFMVRYFKPIDWVLIVGAVLLAFLIPFVSGKGRDVRKPEFKKNQRED